jgi:hypothetical protein
MAEKMFARFPHEKREVTLLGGDLPSTFMLAASRGLQLSRFGSFPVAEGIDFLASGLLCFGVGPSFFVGSWASASILGVHVH